MNFLIPPIYRSDH